MEAISLDLKSDEFVDFFCNKYKEISHKELKNINEFIEIKDQSTRERIYFKIRYNYLKSNCSIIDNVTYIKTSSVDKVNEKNIRYKFEVFFKTIICISIFLFLANESVYFYKQMGLPIYFCYLLPVILELSVFCLFLKKDNLSKFFLSLIVLFNISSFSINTLDNDRKNLELKNAKTQTLLELKKARDSKENRLKKLESELTNYRKIYTEIVAKGYFKKAEESLRPDILRIERQIEETLAHSPLENYKFLSSVNEYDILKNISIRSINLIILKIVLLFVFLLFIKDINYLTQKRV